MVAFEKDKHFFFVFFLLNVEGASTNVLCSLLCGNVSTLTWQVSALVPFCWLTLFCCLHSWIACVWVAQVDFHVLGSSTLVFPHDESSPLVCRYNSTVWLSAKTAVMLEREGAAIVVSQSCEGVIQIFRHSDMFVVYVLLCWKRGWKCDLLPRAPRPPAPSPHSTFEFIDVTVTHVYFLKKSFGTTVLPQWAPCHICGVGTERLHSNLRAPSAVVQRGLQFDSYPTCTNRGCSLHGDAIVAWLVPLSWMSTAEFCLWVSQLKANSACNVKLCLKAGL